MERILSGARLLAMDGGAPAGADALLWRDDRVLRVGRADELRAEHPQAAWDHVEGGLLLPALHDTHSHFYELSRKRAGVDLTGCASVAEVEARLRDWSVRAPDEPEWIGGSGWERALYPDRDRLDRHLLDDIFGDRPVALEARDFHTMLCNSEALRRAGVMDGAESPPGGRVGRGDDGEPDGFLYEQAWSLVWDARPPESDQVAARWIRDCAAHAHSLGLATVHVMEPDTSRRHYQRLAEAGELGVRIVFHSPLDELGARIEEGRRSYAKGLPHLRDGGVKVFMDGSLGSRSAYMSTPYPDGSFGWLLKPAGEFREILLRAARGGVAGTVHAIGDRCLDVVMDGFQAVVDELGEGAPRPFRVEHAQCVRPDQVARLAQLGIYCAMQPVHLGDDIASLPTEWPVAGEWAYPVRDMLDAGVAVGLGSDAPVATLDPKVGIFAAVERRAGNRPGGVQWTPRQAISPREALRLYTADAARGAAWGDELGRLAPGALADVVVLDDVLDEDPSAWLEARVHRTVVGGRTVYSAG